MKIDQALRQAKRAKTNGNLAEARLIYNQILQKFPKNAKARAALIEIGAQTPANPKDIESLIGLFQNGKFSNAVELGNALVKKYPRVAVIYNILGATYAALGQGARAEEAYQVALKLEPKNVEIYANLARFYQGINAHDRAVEVFQQALQIAPKTVALQYNLGLSFQMLGHTKDAIFSYQSTLKLNPKLPEAWNNLGVVQQVVGDLDAAAECYENALKLNDKYAEAHNNLGTLYNVWDQHDDAKRCFETALACNVKYSPAYINLCELLEKLNQPEGMLDVIITARQQLQNLSPDLLYFQALGAYRAKRYEDAKETLADIPVEHIAEQRRTSFLHLKAQIAHSLGQCDQAYQLFQQMNDTFAQSADFAKHDVDGLFERIKHDALSAATLPTYSLTQDIAKHAPVFLIGFPRSGTTLLDTVLMGHSQVSVVEEQNMVPLMEHAVLGKNTIWQAESFVADAIERARDVYFQKLSEHIDTDSPVFIDKMPLNITKVPLMHRVFPNARYILALRHPMDSILSCWMQNFALNAAMGNMLSLPRISAFYEYAMTIFDVASTRYDLDVHHVRYEDLVVDLETEARLVISFLGLEWQEKLLDYQTTAKSRGRIHTPSYSQVVQPLYKTASDRWRAYEHHLVDEKRRLDKWIVAFGYDR